MKRLLFLILTSATVALADVKITFVPPPMQGKITLGVFDSNEHLVRILKENAAVEEFEILRDGLSLMWDETDQQGQPLPEGAYRVRGIVAAGIEVEMEELFGNDFAPTRVNAIRGVAILDKPTVLARLMDGTAAILQVESGITLPMALAAEHFAAHLESYAVADAHRVIVYQGEEQRQFASERMVTALALDEQNLYVASEEGVRKHTRQSQETELIATPAVAQSIALVGGVLHMVADGRIWRRVNEVWQPFSAEGLDMPVSIKPGAEGTLWVIDHGGDFPGAKQFSAQGEFLRSLEPDPDGPIVQDIAQSSEDSDHLLLLEKSPSHIILRYLTKESVTDSGGETVSTWRNEWQRIIESSPLEDSGMAGATALRLPPNALAGNQSQTLDVEAVLNGGSILIQTVEGLPLARIRGPHPGAGIEWRTADSRDDLKLAVHDAAGGVVYRIKDIRRLLLFDAGEYRLGND